jgi:hypothetical protein
MMKMLLNGLLFQLGWFACVLGGDSWALIATTIIFVVHQVFFVTKNSEWLGISAIVFIGFIVDNMLAYFQVFQFQSATLFNIPIWLLCIWALFAATLVHSLSWLRQNLLLSIVLAAFAGPASYLAGSKLASVILLDPLWISLLPIAICWSILMPLLLRLMGWFVYAK